MSHKIAITIDIIVAMHSTIIKENDGGSTFFDKTNYYFKNEIKRKMKGRAATNELKRP